MASLAVIILTYNEELHLERALRSVRSVAKEIFVIDSFSTDATVEIGRRFGAAVLQNPFTNQARQVQWALAHAPITADWVMRLDADEELEPDLVEEIEQELGALPPEVTGVNLKRKHIFMGRWIRHGGRYPLILLRIWRRGRGEVEDRWMDEHMFVREGRTVTFKGGFTDHNLKDLGFFTAKHNSYATREALEYLGRKYGLTEESSSLSAASSSVQAAGKRAVKNLAYEWMPFWLAATGYFLYRYIVQLGFLDGLPGLIYHVLQGFWYRFLVGAKIVEFERGLEGASDREEVRKRLSRLSGSEV